MKQDNFVDALGELDEGLIGDARDFLEKKHRKRISLRRVLSIGACAILISGLLLTAEATGGSVSNLLAPLFGMAQTEMVDQIGVPVGESDTDHGYTLSADAIIGDRYNTAIVYTLTREDGQPLPDNISFREWKNDVVEGAGGGGSLHPVPDPEHPERIQFIETWSRSRPLIGRYVTASFSDLMIYEGDSQYTMLTEGTWELNYTLRYPDTSVTLPVKDMEVRDKAEKEYILKKGFLSPVGIHLEGIVKEPRWGEQKAIQNFSVSLRLSDGTMLLLGDCNRSYSFSKGAATAKFNFQALFDEPIPLEQIEALLICGTEVRIG